MGNLRPAPETLSQVLAPYPSIWQEAAGLGGAAVDEGLLGPFFFAEIYFITIQSTQLKDAVQQFFVYS